MTLEGVPAHFHDRLDELCDAMRSNPSALGVAAGLSKSTVAGWKKKSEEDKGRVNGKVLELIKLAEYCKVTLDWLVGRSEVGGPKRPGAPSADASLGPDTLAMART